MTIFRKFHPYQSCNDPFSTPFCYDLCMKYFIASENLFESTRIHHCNEDISTVWKFHDFSIAQILLEINSGDSRSAKSAILPHLEALNFDFL